MNRVPLLSAAFIFACLASPVAAGEHALIDLDCRPCVADAISELTDSIALWEAMPNPDEVDKVDAIAAANFKIRKLRAVLGPPQPDWPTPCCYTRKPMYIR